jgi:hypothetical protein
MLRKLRLCSGGCTVVPSDVLGEINKGYERHGIDVSFQNLLDSNRSIPNKHFQALKKVNEQWKPDDRDE